MAFGTFPGRRTLLVVYTVLGSSGDWVHDLPFLGKRAGRAMEQSITC
jgi:hypothetical protein